MAPRFLRYFLLLPWLCVGPLVAVEYHVAPTGADENSGSAAEPWRTLQHAAEVLQPGDIATIRAGSYAPMEVRVSGSAAGGYVTFRAAQGESVVIDGTGLVPSAEKEADALILIRARHHVIVEGFELRNFRTNELAPVPAGIFLSGACQHVQIRQCNIHHIESTGGDTRRAGNAFGLAVYGSSATPATDIIIEGNEIHHLKTGSSECLAVNGNVTRCQVLNNRVHDNNNIGIVFIGYEKTCPVKNLDRARAGVCRGNVVWNISSQNNQAYQDGDYSAGGIYCDGAASILIERNVSYDNDIGIELASEHPSRLTQAITVRDNFVYGSRQAGLLLGGYARTGTGGTQACSIMHNTFFNNDTLGMDNGEVGIRFRTRSCVLRGNIFFAGPSGLCITAHVSASHNVGNLLDYNLYYAAAAQPKWNWNKTDCASFTQWKRVSRRDTHSLVADPLFVSTSAPDLHVSPSSPAVDAGLPKFRPAAEELDIDAGARVVGARVDIGADEQPQ